VTGLQSETGWTTETDSVSESGRPSAIGWVFATGLMFETDLGIASGSQKMTGSDFVKQIETGSRSASGWTTAFG
jgi:hypothetical protein